jgi:integrase
VPATRRSCHRASPDHGAYGSSAAYCTRFLEDAIAKGVIFVNPLARVRRFEVPERAMHYLDLRQLKLLCEKVGAFYAVLFLSMAFCGLRIGEATGLQWSDVDLERRRLWVRRQAIWRRKKDCPPGEPRWKLVEPKSRAGKRVVEIPAGLVPLLIAHRASLDGSNPLDLVFPSQTGTPPVSEERSATAFSSRHRSIASGRSAWTGTKLKAGVKYASTAQFGGAGACPSARGGGRGWGGGPRRRRSRRPAPPG